MDLYKLKYITRYSNIPRINDENVAEHSFFVSTICMDMLEKFPDADRGKVLSMATIHDWAEAEIDDISHKTKQLYPKVAKALKDAEHKVMKRYSTYIQELFVEYEQCASLEARIVKYADIKQCTQYLRKEVDMGNKYMEKPLEESSTLLYSFQIIQPMRQTIMEFK